MVASVKVKLIPLQIKTFEVSIKGLSSAISHRFTAEEAIEDKQQHKARVPKGARDPKQEFLDSMYVMPGSEAGVKGAKYGFPALWFKTSAVAACTAIDGMTKVMARGAFHVMEDDGGLVNVKSKPPRIRRDVVKIGMGNTSDLRYRAEFKDWSVKLKIKYNSGVISPEQIINMLNVAGFASGVGEMRPSQKCAGSFGMFEVAES